MGWTTGQLRFDPWQRQEDFSSNLCVQTSSGAQSASCTMGTGGPFPKTKEQPGCETDHSSSHLVLRSRMSRSYTSSPPKHLCGMQWNSFNFLDLIWQDMRNGLELFSSRVLHESRSQLCPTERDVTETE
jgi:hypothetical protein